MDAFLQAGERRDEVLDAIAEARDPADARRAVAELLGAEPDTAETQAVTELLLRSFSQSEVARWPLTWASVPE